MKDEIRHIIEVNIQVKQQFLLDQLPALLAATEAVVATLRRGGKVLLFGNGGSAADAQHIATELVNRYVRDRPSLSPLR